MPRLAFTFEPQSGLRWACPQRGTVFPHAPRASA